MRKLILSFLYFVTTIRYPSTDKSVRYFLRDNFYCRIFQLKYVVHDFIVKKKYKVIHYQGEFQQELAFNLPFAYWHHLNGTLLKTISCKNTKELYFFSENHEEKYTVRDWTSNYDSFEVPNMTHSKSYSFSKWKRVPFKEHYQNDLFLFEKPILIIANKYNIEWDEQPVNFLDIPTLDQIIQKCKHKYQIVYNRPLSNHIVSDNSEILDLHEYEWMREKHPEVLLLSDLYQKHQSVVNNFNHLQLMVYANCSHFVSVHGGTATLASYFGGTNILLSKKGIEHEFNEYKTIFPQLSGANIVHAITEQEVLEYVDKLYRKA